MSYGYKILKAAVEQQIEFKDYDSYKDYLNSNYVVSIKEQLNLDGTFVATVRKCYNNNDYLDIDYMKSDLYTIGEYEDMRMFAKSLNVGDKVLCELEGRIIKTKVAKAYFRSDNPEWYDNTTIENLRETDLGVEYDYSGEFITDDDSVYLFMKAAPERNITITSICPGCLRKTYMCLTIKELNKAILFQNSSVAERILASGLNEVEWKFIDTGYCVECQNKISGNKETSKRFFYKYSH